MTLWTPMLESSKPRPGLDFRERVLGPDLAGDAVFRRIEQGLSTKVLDNLLALAPDVAQTITQLLKISERTLARRRRDGHLNPVESDRLYRLVDLYADAVEVLDGIEAADEWMRSPAIALGDRAPLEYAVNEAGANRIKVLLTRIAHGVYS